MVLISCHCEHSWLAYKPLGWNLNMHIGSAFQTTQLWYMMPAFERPKVQLTSVVRAMASCMQMRPMSGFGWSDVPTGSLHELSHSYNRSKAFHLIVLAISSVFLRFSSNWCRWSSSPMLLYQLCIFLWGHLHPCRLLLTMWSYAFIIALYSWTQYLLVIVYEILTQRARLAHPHFRHRYIIEVASVAFKLGRRLHEAPWSWF